MKCRQCAKYRDASLLVVAQHTRTSSTAAHVNLSYVAVWLATGVCQDDDGQVGSLQACCWRLHRIARPCRSQDCRTLLQHCMARGCTAGHVHLSVMCCSFVAQLMLEGHHSDMSVCTRHFHLNRPALLSHNLSGVQTSFQGCSPMAVTWCWDAIVQASWSGGCKLLSLCPHTDLECVFMAFLRTTVEVLL